MALKSNLMSAPQVWAVECTGFCSLKRLTTAASPISWTLSVLSNAAGSMRSSPEKLMALPVARNANTGMIPAVTKTPSESRHLPKSWTSIGNLWHFADGKTLSVVSAVRTKKLRLSGWLGMGTSTSIRDMLKSVSEALPLASAAASQESGDTAHDLDREADPANRPIDCTRYCSQVLTFFAGFVVLAQADDIMLVSFSSEAELCRHVP
jgi:hypothetical protein